MDLDTYQKEYKAPEKGITPSLPEDPDATFWLIWKFIGAFALVFLGYLIGCWNTPLG